ncbi:hypothetical protein [Prevotella nigrescens]|nr:hypothetical protein [Prevotella nigrescens]
MLPDDGLFYSPYQLRGKRSIGGGTLPTLHGLVMCLEPDILARWAALAF